MAKEGRDWFGSLVGIGVFLIGIGLLVLTFKLAFDLFSVSPSQALDLKPGSVVTLAKTGTSFAGVLVRISLLIVMALTGSWVSNRGIALYSSCYGRRTAEAPPVS